MFSLNHANVTDLKVIYYISFMKSHTKFLSQVIAREMVLQMLLCCYFKIVCNDRYREIYGMTELFDRSSNKLLSNGRKTCKICGVTTESLVYELF